MVSSGDGRVLARIRSAPGPELTWERKLAWAGNQATGTGFDGTCRRYSQPQQVRGAEIYFQEHTRRPFLDELEDAEGTQYLYSGVSHRSCF